HRGLDQPEPPPEPVGVERAEADPREEGDQDRGADGELVADEVAQDPGVEDLVGDPAEAREEQQEPEDHGPARSAPCLAEALEIQPRTACGSGSAVGSCESRIQTSG